MKDPIGAFLGTTNIAKIVTKEIKAVESNVVQEKSNAPTTERLEENLNNDYEYARKNIRNLIDEQMSLIPELSSIVLQLQLPEGYQSASRFIASVVDANDKLVQLSERQINPKQPKGNKNNSGNEPSKEVQVETQNNVTNNVMITMTTADLLNSILEKELDKQAITIERD